MKTDIHPPLRFLSSYAGTYRLAYYANGKRRLQVRRGKEYVEINADIPAYVRGVSAAANFFKV